MAGATTGRSPAALARSAPATSPWKTARQPVRPSTRTTPRRPLPGPMDRSRPRGALHTPSSPQTGYIRTPCQFRVRLMARQDPHLPADTGPVLPRARTVDHHHHHQFHHQYQQQQQQPLDLTDVEDRILGMAIALDRVVDHHPTAMDLGPHLEAMVLDLEAMVLDLEATGLLQEAQALQRWAWRQGFVRHPPGARSRGPVRHTTNPNTRQASTMTGRMSGRSLSRHLPRSQTPKLLAQPFPMTSTRASGRNWPTTGAMPARRTEVADWQPPPPPPPPPPPQPPLPQPTTQDSQDTKAIPISRPGQRGNRRTGRRMPSQPKALSSFPHQWRGKSNRRRREAARQSRSGPRISTTRTLPLSLTRRTTAHPHRLYPTHRLTPQPSLPGPAPPHLLHHRLPGRGVLARRPSQTMWTTDSEAPGLRRAGLPASRSAAPTLAGRRSRIAWLLDGGGALLLGKAWGWRATRISNYQFRAEAAAAGEGFGEWRCEVFFYVNMYCYSPSLFGRFCFSSFAFVWMLVVCQLCSSHAPGIYFFLSLWRVTGYTIVPSLSTRSFIFFFVPPFCFPTTSWLPPGTL